MTQILSSAYQEGPTQIDGRAYVTERHTLSDGRVMMYEYLRSQTVNPDLVMASRAVNLQAQLDEQAEAEGFATVGNLPLTKLQFESKFSDAEWAAVQAFNASYEQIESLSPEQKLAIRRGLHSYNLAQDIRLDDPRTVAQVILYEMLGIITAGRASEVLNG